METINGCTLILSSEAAEPIGFGEAETGGAYRWNPGDAPMLGMIVISPGSAEHLFEPAQTT